MADRVVKVKLTAQVQEYIAGMERASQATRDTGSEAEKLGQQREAFTQLGTASMLAGGLMAAGFGLAVTKAADFDQQMSKVNASTHESAENMALLRAEAIRTGADSVFTASESANAIDELARAGVATADVLSGGLQGSLDLAAAGELGVADAAEIAATAMTQFKLSGQEVPHIADLLAAGAGKAQGSVSDLSQALNQGGLVASQTGLSIEETVGGLSAFASAGLLGSDAGTSFKSMLQSLTPTSKEAATLMKEYNLEAYDAQGNFIGLAAYADKLRTGLSDMTVEQQNATLKTIFGSDAVRAASVLYDQGADGIQKWIDAVDDAGYAAETAALKQDNLIGDVEKLGGAFDSTFIQGGSAANGALRDMTQNVTEAVDAYNELPVPVQQGVFWLGALTTAVVLGTGAYMVGVPKIAAYRIALASMGTTAQRTGVALETTMKWLGRATLILGAAEGAKAAGAWAADLWGYAQSAEELAKGLGDAATAQKTLENTLGNSNVADSLDRMFGGDGNARDRLGYLLSDIGNAQADIENGFFGSIIRGSAQIQTLGLAGNSGLGTLKDDLKEVDAELAGMVSSGKAEQAADQWAYLTSQTDGSEDSINRLKKLFPEYTDSLNGVADASSEAGDGSKNAAEGLQTVASKADEAEESISDLADMIRGYNELVFGSRDAARNYEQAIDNVTSSVDNQKQAFLDAQATAYEEAHGSLDGYVESLDGFRATLDITTQEGRDNQAALDALAQATLDNAAAIFERTGSEEDAADAVREGRRALKEQLGQFDITGQAAKDYADDLGLIPESVTSRLSMPGLDEALNGLARIAWYDGREIHMTNFVETIESQANRQPITERFGIPNENGGFYDYAFENGGFAPGIYKGGPPLYKFAEQNTGWEAFISGKAGQEQQNIATWAEAGRRLGIPRESQSSSYMESTTFHVIQNNPTVEPSYKGVLRSSRLKAGSTHV